MRLIFVFFVFVTNLTVSCSNHEISYSYQNMTTNDEDVPLIRDKKDYYYYYYEEGSSAGSEPRYLLFSVVMGVSAVVLVLQILITIYVPTIPNTPMKWHTLNYCCWNVIQLLIFANCSFESGLESFLGNKYISSNCIDIQRMTLIIFYASMIAQAPASLTLHFWPQLQNSTFFQFYIWIPLYFFLDLGIFMVYGSRPWKWGESTITPIQALHAAITILNYLILILVIVCTVIGIVHYFLYFCVFLGRQDSQNSSKFVNLINLIFFLIYTLGIGFVHTPANGINMGTFLVQYVYELILPYINYFVEIGITMVQMNELTTLLIPVVEFVLTYICIHEYRSQIYICCTCGLAYNRPKRIRTPKIPFEYKNGAKITPLPISNTVNTIAVISPLHVINNGYQQQHYKAPTMNYY